MADTNLNPSQRTGIVHYGLSLEQVLSPNFGRHTLNAIDQLQYLDDTLTVEQAFNELQGLNRVQVEGLIDYNLTRQEIQTANFGRHSLNAIDNLRRANPVLFANNRLAFHQVRQLNETQIDGLLHYNLTREQVQTPGFNQDTLNSIDNLMRTNRERFQNPQMAFNEIIGLNEVQIEGITEYRLNRAQVTSPNFGEHSLNAMYSLMQNNNTTSEAAFSVVAGLNQVQVEALISFRLRGRHVLDERLNANTLDNIELLNRFFPSTQTDALADIVMDQLQEYQIRGLNLGLMPEQLGFTIEENGLIHTDTVNNPGRIVDVVSSLSQTEDIGTQEAYREALALNLEQTTGILNIGLSLAQVQNSAFEGNETIQEIYDVIDNDDELEEIEIPLTDRQQAKARELMDEKITRFQQKEESGQQTIVSPGQASLSATEGNTSEQNLSALTTAMNIEQGENTKASAKKDDKPSKSSDKKMGYKY